MHELSVAIELYRVCRAEVEDRGDGRIASVVVAVGELTAVEPELLRFAWEAVTGDGPDAGASIEIDWRPAAQTCPDCGPVDERQPGTWLRLCPTCALPLTIDGGRELDLLTIDFEPAAMAEEVRA